MNAALAARVRQLEAERAYQASVAQFRRERAAAQQARTRRLIDELVQDLAGLFTESAGPVCITCRRVLAPRVRNCPHCRAAASRIAGAA